MSSDIATDHGNVTVSAGTRVAVLDEAACLQALARHAIGRLGFSASALPVVLPVNFTIDDRKIFFRTEPGLKLDAARAGAVVCLEVDDYDVMSHTGSSVLATGRLRLITDADERHALAGLPLEPWGAPGAEHLVELPIELLSGRTIVTA